MRDLVARDFGALLGAVSVPDEALAGRGGLHAVAQQLVIWNEAAAPRVLRSEEEILQAECAGELTIEPTDVIVNAPVVDRLAEPPRS